MVMEMTSVAACCRLRPRHIKCRVRTICALRLKWKPQLCFCHEGPAPLAVREVLRRRSCWCGRRCSTLCRGICWSFYAILLGLSLGPQRSLFCDGVHRSFGSYNFCDGLRDRWCVASVVCCLAVFDVDVGDGLALVFEEVFVLRYFVMSIGVAIVCMVSIQI